jgi:hypothetical protein
LNARIVDIVPRSSSSGAQTVESGRKTSISRVEELHGRRSKRVSDGTRC